MKTYRRIEDTGLYVDCTRLALRLYQLRFKMPKRDRAVLGEHIFKYYIAWMLNSSGNFGTNNFYNYPGACCVALLDLAP